MDIKKIREDFPILKREIRGHKLIYFDNAATTQKPLCVINAISEYYKRVNSNVHRGVHFLSDMATDSFEEARKTTKEFINASKAEEIIFVRGTTEGINLVASSFGEKFIKESDEIIISAMEHHSNIVPWQILCERKKAVLKIIPFNDKGEIIFDEFKNLLSEKTKIISLVHVSNSLGTVNPVKKIIDYAHSKNVPVLIDGAQSAQHFKIDVQELDCDFFVFSGHKIYGPTGIGILYGKEKWLEEMPPYQGGGEMIETVTFKKTTYNKLPYKFEAGTPDISGAIGLSEALKYLNRLGLANISEHEKQLLEYGTNKLMSIEGIKIFGTAKEKVSVFSFLLGNYHPYDVGVLLDKLGIALRTGTHCTIPVMDIFKIPGTVRASLCFYNTKEELDYLFENINRVKEILN